MPSRYDPLWPQVCFVAAVIAVPLALTLRTLGGATRHRRLPRGWTAWRLLRFAVGLFGALVAVLLLALVLEPIGARLSGRAGPEPAAQLAGALGQALAHAGWLGWQGLLLTLPVAAALIALTELRWPRGLLARLGQLCAWPLLGAVASAITPPGATGPLVVVLAAVPALTWLIAAQLRTLPGRWQRWRALAPTPETRVSSLPAAMAAVLGPPAPPRPRGVTTALPLPRTEVLVGPTMVSRTPDGRGPD